MNLSYVNIQIPSKIDEQSWYCVVALTYYIYMGCENECMCQTAGLRTTLETEMLALF